MMSIIGHALALRERIEDHLVSIGYHVGLPPADMPPLSLEVNINARRNLLLLIERDCALLEATLKDGNHWYSQLGWFGKRVVRCVIRRTFVGWVHGGIARLEFDAFERAVELNVMRYEHGRSAGWDQMG